MPTGVTYNFKTVIAWFSIIALFAVIGIYSLIQMKDVIAGVNFDIQGISDGQILTDQKVDITGNAKNIATLSINNRPVGVGEDGTFKDTILLSPGYNIVRVKGDDKFGKAIAKSYRVYYKDDTGPATALSDAPSVAPSAVITN